MKFTYFDHTSDAVSKYLHKNYLEANESSSLTLAAAAAAKSLQLCPTLCDPIDSSPPGSPVPGILQARILEWGAIAFSDKIGIQQIIVDYYID